MPGRSTRCSDGIALVLGCLAALAVARPAVAGADGTSPPPICATDSAWDAKRAALALDDECPAAGPCDLPAVRDAAARDPMVVRVLVHIMTAGDGTVPNGADAAAIAAQLAGLDADFSAHGISFRHEARFHADADYFCIPAYSPSNPAWFAAIEAMKSAYAEDPQHRINIFVSCQSAGTLGTLRGIGTFPWDPDAATALGGIWINAAWFGANQHTLTHEMGHTLGLLHTHHRTVAGRCEDECREDAHAPGDAAAEFAGDLCADTPGTPANYTCEDPPGTDCEGVAWTAYGPTDTGNFMGYAPDHCARRFTPGQAARMHCWTRYAMAGAIDAAGGEEEEEAPLPLAAVALENHPNPANPSTIFRYSLPAPARATLRVYDVSGRLIAALVDERRDAGVFDVNWNGRDRSGAAVPSGVYYARLAAGGEVRTRRVVVLK